MIDPRHNRRVPSGRRLARALAGVLRAMGAAAASAARRGVVADLDAFRPALVRAVLPVVGHEYLLGRQQAARDLRARDAGRRRATGDPLRGAGRDVLRAGTVAAPGATKTGSRCRFPAVVKAGFPFGAGGPPDPAADPLGVSFDVFGAGVPLAVQRLVLDLAGGITDTLRADVRGAVGRGLEAGRPVADIAASLAPLFGPRRAWTIAATESLRASEAGNASYSAEAGAAGMQWMCSADACPGCLKLDGKRVAFGEPFVVLGGGRAAYRAVFHAPLHPNCACTCVAWWAEDERRVRR